MKKVIKIAGSILAVLVAVLAIWQWNNLKSVYIGITATPEKIQHQREANQEKLIEDVNSFLDEPIRDMTAEEKAKVESGEMTKEEVLSEIFAQMQSGQKDKADSSAENKKEKKSEKTAKKDKKDKSGAALKDEIVGKYMSQLYSLQGEYTGRAEATVSQAKSYYVSLRKTQDKASARANTVAKYSSLARGVESECDAKVASVIAGLENELKAIGANTDITGTIRAAYQNEKQLKISYYTSKYMN